MNSKLGEVTRSNGERVGFYLSPYEQEEHTATTVLIEAILEVANAMWALDKRLARLDRSVSPEEEALDRVIR